MAASVNCFMTTALSFCFFVMETTGFAGGGTPSAFVSSGERSELLTAIL